MELHRDVLLNLRIIIEINSLKIFSNVDFDTGEKLPGNEAKIFKPLTAKKVLKGILGISHHNKGEWKEQQSNGNNQI